MADYQMLNELRDLGHHCMGERSALWAVGEIERLRRNNRQLAQRLFDLDEELLVQVTEWAKTTSHDLIVQLLAECKP